MDHVLRSFFLFLRFGESVGCGEGAGEGGTEGGEEGARLSFSEARTASLSRCCVEASIFTAGDSAQTAYRALYVGLDTLPSATGNLLRQVSTMPAMPAGGAAPAEAAPVRDSGRGHSTAADE